MIRPVILLALAAIPALAADGDPAPSAAHSYIMDVAGSIGSLLLGLIQLVVGLAIITFAIKTGLNVVSKLLGGLDIWGEVKKRNIAVALLAAGVVISYTNVLGTGIESMTKPLAGLVGGDWFSGLTGLVAGVINLLISITVASFAIKVTFTAMDKLTKDLDEKSELVAGNVAIGVLYCGVLIAVSQVVASAISGVGLAVQGCLSSLLKPILG